MSSSVSPYTKRMNTSMIEIVAEFLGWKDSYSIYSCVDKKHKKDVLTSGFRGTKVITIPSQLVNNLFENMGKFSKLHTLWINCEKAHFYPLQATEAKKRIQRLYFERSRMLPAEYVDMFLRAIPNLQGFGLRRINGSCHLISQANSNIFQAMNGHQHLNVVLPNLPCLTELDVDDACVYKERLTEILRDVVTLRLVRMTKMEISRAIFERIGCNQSLTHLNFSESSITDVDHLLLANCHSLESFSPWKEISENALVAIIEANCGLKRLDLSTCLPDVVTDRVLEAIGRKLPALLILLLPSYGSLITDEGLTSITDGCQYLRTLSLPHMKEITSASINKLVKCSKLTELVLSNNDLSDEFLIKLLELKNLKYLDLTQSFGLSEEGVLKFKAVNTQTTIILENVILGMSF